MGLSYYYRLSQHAYRERPAELLSHVSNACSRINAASNNHNIGGVEAMLSYSNVMFVSSITLSICRAQVDGLAGRGACVVALRAMTRVQPRRAHHIIDTPYYSHNTRARVHWHTFATGYAMMA